MREQESAENPRDAMEVLLAGQFGRWPKAIRILTTLKRGTQWLIPRSVVLVLGCLIEKANWSPDEQGGIPATFVSAAAIASETGLSENSVHHALQHLGTGKYRRRNHEGNDVHELPGLGVIRKATVDEALKVTEGFQRLASRPPQVWVFRDPKFWNLSGWAAAQFGERYAPSKSRTSARGFR
jgi:hypothetical protein